MEENVPNVTENVTPYHEFYDDIAGLHILLDDMYDECKECNWDGYDAYPINELTLEYAHQFIELIPDEIPMPSVGCEPTGDITFEWYKGSDRDVVVSISDSGLVDYVTTIGKEYFSGSLDIENHEFPEILLDMIKKMYYNKE